MSQARPLHVSSNGQQLDKTAVAVDSDVSHRFSIFRTPENDPVCTDSLKTPSIFISGYYYIGQYSNLSLWT